MNMTLPKYSDGIKTVVQTSFGGIDKRAGAGDGAIADMLNMTSDHYPVLSTRGRRSSYDDFLKLGIDPYERNESFVAFVCDVSDVPYYLVIRYDDAAESYYLIAKTVDEDGSVRAAFVCECEAASELIEDFLHPKAVAFNNRLIVFVNDRMWRVYRDKSNEMTCEQLECEVPVFDHVCVNRDRIWGTKANEIYCCASCEPGEWYRYSGTAADSFYAQIPEVSFFTGIASYAGSVYFFTSENVYRMYGTTPDAFSLVSLGIYGMDATESRSFGTAAQVLFYNSVLGPACFNGSSVQLIGHPLGEAIPRAVMGIGSADKYYMVADKHLYVYDLHRRTWQVHSHAVSNDEVKHIGVFGGRVIIFALDFAEYLHAVAGESLEYSRMPSHVEFADISEGALYGVTPCELVVQTWLGEGAELSLSISCDGGEWTRLWSTTECGRHIHRVRFSPKTRCDYYRIRIDGVGEWKLYSLGRSYSVNSSTPYGE